MIYTSSKTYGHNEGLSCAFRQWRAKSCCALVHGYSLSFYFRFETTELDIRNWCADFGDLKELKAWLHEMFDHTLCVAEDDPELATFRLLAEKGVANLKILPSVGCEKFAELAFKKAVNLIHEKYQDRVRVVLVEVREHDGNSASCRMHSMGTL